MEVAIRSANSDGPATRRVDFLLQAVKAMAATSPPVAAFLGRELHKISQEKGLKLSREVLLNFCRRCEAPLPHIIAPSPTLPASHDSGAGEPALSSGKKRLGQARVCPACGYVIRRRAPSSQATAKVDLARAAARMQAGHVPKSSAIGEKAMGPGKGHMGQRGLGHMGQEYAASRPSRSNSEGKEVASVEGGSSRSRRKKRGSVNILQRMADERLRASMQPDAVNL